MATQLQLAEAQILGYAHAKRGFELIPLIKNMALTKSEWNKMKRKGWVKTMGLTKDEVDEIEDHFK